MFAVWSVVSAAEVALTGSECMGGFCFFKPQFEDGSVTGPFWKPCSLFPSVRISSNGYAEHAMFPTNSDALH